MFNNKEAKRYARHLILSEVGEEGQQKLKQSRVLVIGAGGLGCPVLQYLCAAGVGTIGIADFDKVDESNLQRQVLYSSGDVGKLKAEVAKEKLEAQNPFVRVAAYAIRLNSENALQLIAQYDLVVDGTDNFATRYLVNDACVMLDKPLIFGSIFKFSGQVSLFNYKGGPTYRCLYPDPPAAGEIPSCAETGVIGVLPGICGMLQANEVIKLLTGIGEVLSGRLLTFDALTMQFELFEIALQPSNKKIAKLIDYDLFCNNVNEISSEELRRKIKEKSDFQLVDVREESEYRKKNIGGLLIPLKQLGEHLDKISREKEVIVHCQSGARSKQAVNFLRERGFVKVYSLRNGILDF
jgi:adenylyltransferase/sulfurtransferase